MSDFDGQAALQCARLLSAAASDNATSAFVGPCALKGIQGYNAKSAAVYLKLYDKASAPAYTDTPVKTIYLPATAAFALDFTAGFQFNNGLAYRITAAVADNDNTALSAGDVLCLSLDYV